MESDKLNNDEIKKLLQGTLLGTAYHRLDFQRVNYEQQMEKLFGDKTRVLYNRVREKHDKILTRIKDQKKIHQFISKLNFIPSIPPEIEKCVNDFKSINAYCDEVRIMAYDQRNVDLKLNKAKGGVNYYMPVADKDWVKKVLDEAIKTINKKKIVLGIANFGYEYEVVKNDSDTLYDKRQSLTYTEMMTLASTTGSTPKRNAAGELSFVYEKQVPVSSTTPTLTVTSTRYISFSDATAIQEKVTLARKYGLKGVYLFKVDGESDPKLWTVLK
jgi:GH18 family chitinase